MFNNRRLLFPSDIIASVFGCCTATELHCTFKVQEVIPGTAANGITIPRCLNAFDVDYSLWFDLF